jgi:hypothetical protein
MVYNGQERKKLWEPLLRSIPVRLKFFRDHPCHGSGIVYASSIKSRVTEAEITVAREAGRKEREKR